MVRPVEDLLGGGSAVGGRLVRPGKASLGGGSGRVVRFGDAALAGAVWGDQVVSRKKTSLAGGSGLVARSSEVSLSGEQFEVDGPAPLIRACHRGRRVVVADGAPPGGTASHGRRAEGERALGSWLGSARLTSTAPLELRGRVLRLVPGVQSHHMDDMWDLLASIGQRFYTSGQSNAWGRRAMEALNGTGGGSSIPASIMIAHSEELRAAGSLSALARARRAARAPSRLSRARVMAVTEGSRAVYAAGGIPGGDHALAPVSERRFLKDVELLSDIGENGVRVTVDPDFRPVPERGDIPALYKDNMDAVNGHNYNNLMARHSLMLSKEAAAQEELNLMNFGFAPMYGKEKGRVTSNCSGLSGGRAQRGDRPGLIPLNTPLVAMKGELLYGAIHHPTIEDVAVMVDRAIREYGVDEVVLFKEDLRGFFQLVDFDPEGVRLMAFAYLSEDADTEGAVLVSLSGNFGWSVMPFVMEVGTRVLRVVVQNGISGFSLQYCDDVMAASERARWRSDQMVIKQTVEDLFGPGAYAADKSESSEDNCDRRTDILGWAIILSTQRVDLARKNREKTYYTFLTTDYARGLSLKKRQQLCAYADRYAEVFAELGALNKMLFTMLGGQERIVNPEALYEVSNEKALVAIEVWKTFFVMSEYEHRQGAASGRPMQVYLPGPARGTVEFDGSLDGVGWRIYDENGRVLLSGYRVVGDAFYPDDYVRREGSQYQNSMELIAFAIAMVHLATLGWRDCTIAVRGDSMTVLCWLTEWNFASTRAVFPTLLIIVLCETLNIRFKRVFEHISSEDNFICDCLSRGKVGLAVNAGDCGPAGPEAGVAGGLLEQAMGLVSLNAELTPDVFFERWVRYKALVGRAVGTPRGKGRV